VVAWRSGACHSAPARFSESTFEELQPAR